VFVIALAVALLDPTAAAPAPANSAEEDKVVCKMIKQPDTGSNIRKRQKTCMLAADWKQLEVLNDRAARKLLSDPKVSPAPVPNAAGGTGGSN